MLGLLGSGVVGGGNLRGGRVAEVDGLGSVGVEGQDAEDERAEERLARGWGVEARGSGLLSVVEGGVVLGPADASVLGGQGGRVLLGRCGPVVAGGEGGFDGPAVSVPISSAWRQAASRRSAK